ncbi:hypothetical protein AX15_002428 [Amanita polypyramis BW_CC]|nr:hypothetical protein AX15_002428 [Amanita polypyramis BW_CC]
MVSHPFVVSRSFYRFATARSARVAMSVPRLPMSAAKYSSSSTMSGNDPEVLEIEKKRNLSKTQHRTSTPLSHAPGWNESLATESEAFVKADQATETNSELQTKTVEYLRTRHSLDDRAESTTADYARDEVMGPLSGAEGREDTNTDADDVFLNSAQKASSTVEAFSAGGDTVASETVEEEVTEIHKKKVKGRPSSEKPTSSEEAVRADTGKPVYT